MSQNAPQLFGKEYSSTVMLLLQQRGSRLRKGVMSGTHVGDQASPVDQIGSVSMQQVTSRFGAIGRVDAALSRRWVNPTDFDLPQLFDKFDELKIFSDPKSKYVLNAVYAAGRTMDELIIEAFFGTATTGTTGSGSTSFSADGGITIAVDEGASGNTGLTVAKLRAAKKSLMAAEVDFDNDSLWCGINAEAHDSLLQEMQVVSTDFNEKPVLVDGKIMRFMGFNFIHTELYGVDGSSFRRLPAWAQSGMHLGIWDDIQTDISQRKDLTSLPWQAYLKMSLGATRIEGEKIIEILADES